ncbi:MAG: hypothetical protein VX000_12430 [Myxococcota bacterium]|nr:hypothetical protein [Myxococcota bacterium]
MKGGTVLDAPMQAMLDVLDAQVAGAGVALLPAGARRRRASAWLSEALSHTEDEVRAARLQRRCPVQGAPTHAYLHRLLQESGRPTLLTGIRFRGGDPSQPFVDLMAWDRPLRDRQSWRRVRARVAQSFGAFQPQWLRVRWPGQAGPPVPRGARRIDRYMVAGRLEDLRNGPRPWGHGAVEVVPATDARFHDAYSSAFHRWQLEVGPRGTAVIPADAETWSRCLATGAIVCARSNGQWAGVMAASRIGERSLEGYCVQEMFLDRRLRGRRRAPVLQRHLVDVLLDRGRDCLWGTIHGTNAPALRAALRSGRRIVETWWCLEL